MQISKLEIFLPTEFSKSEQRFPGNQSGCFQETAGVFPGHALLVEKATVHPLAPPGLQRKSGEEYGIGAAFSGTQNCKKIRSLTDKNFHDDSSVTYEYTGVATNAFSFNSGFRPSAFTAIETVDANGHLVSSRVDYSDAGINLVLLGPENARFPIGNVKEVTTLRHESGYETAIYTYDKQLFIACTRGDGLIKAFGRATCPAFSSTSAGKTRLLQHSARIINPPGFFQIYLSRLKNFSVLLRNFFQFGFQNAN